jgi:hypothetical protein
MYGIVTISGNKTAQGASWNHLMPDAFARLSSLMGYISSGVSLAENLEAQLGVVADSTLALIQVLTYNNITAGPLENVATTVADVISKINEIASFAKSQIVGFYSQNQNSWEDTAEHFSSIIVQLALALCAVILVFSVLYLTSFLLNFKLGICVMSGVQGFLSTLCFALCIALSVGLVALRDACSQTEFLIVSLIYDLSHDITLTKFFSFYFDQNSAGYFDWLYLFDVHWIDHSWLVLPCPPRHRGFFPLADGLCHAQHVLHDVCR